MNSVIHLKTSLQFIKYFIKYDHLSKCFLLVVKYPFIHRARDPAIWVKACR